LNEFTAAMAPVKVHSKGAISIHIRNWTISGELSNAPFEQVL